MSQRIPPTPSCPRCGIPVQWEGNPYRPFCSQRCRELDLLQWLKEKYRIPEKIGEEEAHKENPENEGDEEDPEL